MDCQKAKPDQDLRNLLISWALDHHYDHFVREKITINHLKLMQPKHVDKLFQYLPLGDQILFEHHLNNDFNKEVNNVLPTHNVLRTTSRKTSSSHSAVANENSQDDDHLMQTENNETEDSETELAYDNLPRHSFTISTATQKCLITTPRRVTAAIAVPVARHSHATSTSPAGAGTPLPVVVKETPSRPYSSELPCRYDLRQILADTSGGQVIAAYYKKHQHLKEEHRTSLINVIARYIDASGCTLTLAESYDIETQIVEIFPTEKAEFYRTSKRGRIYNKVSNMKSIYRKLSKVADNEYRSTSGTASPAQSGSIKTGIKQEEFEEEYNDCIVSEMRTSALSNGQVMEFWKSTQSMRFKCIEDISDLKIILEKWPEYKDTNAVEYISMDFFTKFPSATKFSQVFYESIGKLEKFLFTKVSPSSNAFKYLQLYQKASKDSQHLIILWVLHQIFPPHQFTSTNEFGVKRKKRYSIADSQNASICIRNSAQLIDIYLETKDTPTPPMILVVGDLGRNIQEIFVYFEGIRYPMKSVIEAAEFCLHLYFLFNIAFPEESQLCHNFMQSYFLNIEPEMKNSRIYTTINELNAY